MKNKPFITANVRDITDAWLREDISYSRMVEVLNETVFSFVLRKIKEIEEEIKGEDSSFDRKVLNIQIDTLNNLIK